MAKGRMLNRSISMSVKFQQLPDDMCRLLATWTIPQLDIRGVFYGDAVTVKSLIFPMRMDINPQQVEAALLAMESVGLIVLFESEGRRWQFWPGFKHNQGGLRENREKPTLPQPPPAGTTPGALPPQSGSTPRQDKLREEKEKISAPPPDTYSPDGPTSDVSDPEALRQAQIERERQERANRLQDDTFSNAAVKVHSEVMGVPLTYDQRLEIAEKVKDCEVWRMTLDFWRLRGWQKPNVKGQIDRYKESLANASAGRPHAGNTRPAAQMTAADKQTAPTMRPPLRYEEQPDGSMLPIYADEVKA